MIDSVSETITTDDGLPFCGSIILELVDSEKHQTYLTFDERTLTALTTDDALIGVYEAQILVYLEEYPDIARQVDFSVIVNPCEVTEITLENGPEDTRYAISSQEKKLITPIVNQGICKYPVTF